jgi:hypothetical protein
MVAISPNFKFGPSEDNIFTNLSSSFAPSVQLTRLPQDGFMNSCDDQSILSHTTLGIPHNIMYLGQWEFRLEPKPPKYPIQKCRNPSLEFATKARACKSAGQEGSSKVTFHASGNAKECEGMNPHTSKGTPTLGVRISVDSKFSKSNCSGRNSLDWSIHCIIGKLLEHRCLKWACMTHLHTLKHKLWSKERLGVKLAVWLPSIKSQESPRFPCMQVVCHIPLERTQRGLQLYFKPYIIERSTKKVMGPQSHGSPKFVNFGTPIWESQDKMPFGCGLHGVAQSIL